MKGEPTKALVEALRAAFPPPLTVGREIQHSEFESAIGLKKNTFRYRSVFAAWRKALEDENGTYLHAIHGKGYVVADSSQKIEHAVQGLETAARKVRRSEKEALSSNVLELTEEERRTRDSVLIRSSKIALALATAPRNDSD